MTREELENRKLLVEQTKNDYQVAVQNFLSELVWVVECGNFELPLSVQEEWKVMREKSLDYREALRSRFGDRD